MVRQLGSSNADTSYSVAVDGNGDVYMSGTGDLGGSAGSGSFLVKYAPSGDLLWSKQVGTAGVDESSFSVAVDSHGNPYISGYTFASLNGMNAGLNDAFVTKFDTSGTALWTGQIGTADFDYSNAVAIDAVGNAFITGWTYGNLAAHNRGPADAFLTKFDSSGASLVQANWNVC